MAEYKFDKLIKDLKKIDETLDSVSKKTQEAHLNVANLGKNPEISKLYKEIEKLNTANRDLIKIQKDQEKTEKQLQAEEKKRIKNAEKYNILIQKRKAEEQALSNEIRKRARDEAKLKREMLELEQLARKEIKSDKELIRYNSLLAKKRANMVVRTKQERQEYDRLTVAIAKNEKIIRKSDASIGRFQRNVGNYKSALKGLAGTLGIAGLGMAAISYLKESTKLYEEQTIAVQKLNTVLKERTNATKEEIAGVIELTKEQQKLGVIGDEVQIAGAQQIATFVKQSDSVKTLIPAMNNLIAQQKGLNATQGDATNIANLMGRALQGQLGSLTRVGISFDEAQGKILKYGTEEERAAALAEIITNNVGNMNAELAKTDLGAIKQAKNNLGDLQEQIGKGLIPIISAFYRLLLALINAIKKEMSPVFNEIGANLKDIKDNIVKLFGATDSAGKSFFSLSNILKILIIPTKILWKQLSLVVKVLGWFVGLITRIIDSSTFLTNVLGAIGDSFKWIFDKINDAYNAINRFFNEINKSKSIKERIKEIQKEFSNLDKKTKLEVTGKVKELNRQLQIGAISATEYMNAMNELYLSTKKIKSSGNILPDKKAGETISAGSESAGAKINGYIGEIEMKKSDIENVFSNQLDTAKTAVVDTRSKWEKFIDRFNDKSDKRSFLAKLFNIKDDGAAMIEESFSKAISLMQNYLSQKRDLIDEEISLIDEKISKIQDEINAEKEKNQKLIEAGQAYDLTKKKALEKRLAEEQKAKEKALREEEKIKKRQKEMDIISANIAIATSILNALKLEPPWLGILMATVMGGLGFIQLAQIKSAKYADGTEYVEQGDNPSGIDTVPAMVNIGERIVPTGINKNIPKGFRNEWLPDAAKLWLNGGISNLYINSNGEIVSKLDKIVENTSTDVIRDVNGNITFEKKGNHFITYN